MSATADRLRTPARMAVESAGVGRALLVAGGTALASGLLLVGAAIARIRGEAYADAFGPLGAFDVYGGRVLAPIADAGSRAGVVFGVVLLVVPVLAVLDQAVRLGSAERARRYAALRVAGASPADLRRWGLAEVGVPAVAGAVLGLPVWWLLRALLGAPLATSSGAIVPPAGPGLLAVPVVLAVAAYGAWVGLRVTRPARPRPEGRAPRPWGPGLVVVVAATLVGGRGWQEHDALLFALMGLLVLGLLGTPVWLAWAAATVVSRRTSAASTLLATRRLVADPGPAGRAVAAVGALGLTAGVLVVLVEDVGVADEYARYDYLAPMLVVAVLAGVGLLLVATSLTLHVAESVHERRRETAALVATGVPVSVVAASQRRECLLLTVPAATLACLLGGLGLMTLLAEGPGTGAVVTSGLVAVAALGTGILVTVAALLASRAARPWLVEAASLASLRTE